MQDLKRILFVCGLAVYCAAMSPLSAQQAPPPPAPPAPPTVPQRIQHLQQGGPIAIPKPAALTPIAIQPANATPGAKPPPDALAFDATTKEYDAKPGELSAPFVFNITNAWTNEITIRTVHTSCGCTVAKLPSNPWILPPGSNGQVNASVNLINKFGTITKTLTFDTSVGNKLAYLKVVIPPREQSGVTAPSETDRKAAMQKAAADRQSVFTDASCAKCHVQPGQGKMGEELYVAACGICHESPHRATMVPDLHALKQPTNLDYWKAMISFGKPNTLMPAFATSQGGPLSDIQIQSLAAYLDRAISHHYHFSGRQTTNAAITPLIHSPTVQ